MNATTTTRSLHVHGRRFADVAPMVDAPVEAAVVVEAAGEVEAVVVEAPQAVVARPRHVHGPRFHEVAPLAPVVDVVDVVDVEMGDSVVVEQLVDAIDADTGPVVGIDLGEHQLDDDVAITASGAMVRVALHVRSGARVVLVTVDGEGWHRVAHVPVDASDDEALLAVEQQVQDGIAALQTTLMPRPTAAFVVASLLEAARADVDSGALWDRWQAVSSDVFRAPTLVPLRRFALAG